MALNRTQKEVIVVGICILITIIANSLYIGAMDQHTGIIRFHVIANSDSSEDQVLKLKVRDGLLKIMEKDIAKLTLEAKDKEEIEIIRDYVTTNQDKINGWAEEIIKREGYSYKVKSHLGVTYIPEKTYGETTFPAGNYEALNIVIGKGAGHNWWCVLFPPLCLIDATDGEYKERLGITEKEGIVLKSKVAEMIEEYE